MILGFVIYCRKRRSQAGKCHTKSPDERYSRGYLTKNLERYCVLTSRKMKYAHCIFGKLVTDRVLVTLDNTAGAAATLKNKTKQNNNNNKIKKKKKTQSTDKGTC